MDVTFQVPMQYCSLWHQTLLPSPVTSTTGSCFCFGSVSSFFLELFLHWSQIAYWAPTDLGSSSFSALSFCFFILFMVFSRQEYWSGLSFHSPVYNIFSELSTMSRLSCVALHGMAHSYHRVRQGCGPCIPIPYSHRPLESAAHDNWTAVLNKGGSNALDYLCDTEQTI